MRKGHARTAFGRYQRSRRLRQQYRGPAYETTRCGVLMRIALRGRVIVERDMHVPTIMSLHERTENRSTESPAMPTTPIRQSGSSTDESTSSDAVAVQRPNSNKENFDPGLFARDRNPRRKATKLFGEPPTPPPQRQQKPKSSAASVPDVSESNPARPAKKRKSQQDYHWPSERRRKRSRKSDLVPESRTMHPCGVMDDHGVPVTDEPEIRVSAPTVMQSNSGQSDGLPIQSGHLEPRSDQQSEYLEYRPVILSGSEPQSPVNVNTDLNAETAVHRDPAADADAEPDADTASLPQFEPTKEVETQSETATDCSHVTEHTSEPGSFPESVSTVELQYITEPKALSNSHTLPEEDFLPMPETPPFVAEWMDESENPPSHGRGFMSELASIPEHLQGTYNPLRRPARDIDAFLRFAEQMKTWLREKSTAEPPTVGTRQAKRILALLEAGRPPDENDAAFVNGPEATEKLSSRFAGIIVTEGQQLLPLQTIDQFLGEYYNARSKVWIQDPSYELTQNRPSVREVTIAQIRKRFLPKTAAAAAAAAASTPPPSEHPWNLLELATHCDDGLRPVFLNNEDCRLLTKLKIPHSERQARRRAYSPGYKEVEKWALLAQAGALTEPHQDSHGYATFITVNVGLVGFGWLSLPTPSDRAAWCASPHDFLASGRWRYIVLRPGQTVYFPPGTVHFVFRHPAAGDSLAFGGHVLRCSGLVRWVSAMLEERRFPNITNEDITASAPGYLAQVEKFVKEALQSGDEERIAKWGGREEIEEFLRLKKEFTG